MKFTQEQYDSLPILGGRRKCPPGDYSGVKRFGDGASFGKYASFD